MKSQYLTYFSSYADYYPFGMKMPGKFGGGNYRYAYQGQEKDTETGFEAFELRQWDGRIGRWMSTDPYGQHASPYLGMGNNPMNRIDPDGGFDVLGDPPISGIGLMSNLDLVATQYSYEGLCTGKDIFSIGPNAGVFKNDYFDIGLESTISFNSTKGIAAGMGGGLKTLAGDFLKFEHKSYSNGESVNLYNSYTPPINNTIENLSLPIPFISNNLNLLEGIKFINDVYNSTIEYMRSSIDVFKNGNEYRANEATKYN